MIITHKVWSAWFFIIAKAFVRGFSLLWISGTMWSMMIDEYRVILDRARARHAETLKQARHLSKLNKKNYDQKVWEIHEEVFASIDCTKCGNCCRALGPRFRHTDVKIICKAIGEDPRSFTKEYLKDDEEGVGYVLKELPCPFLNEDNTCREYELRTLSCREYPHTLSRGIQKHLVRLAHDSLICPAASLILDRLL
ncbi:MAG TPA: YkgJ family cysteine cluster protein [Treponemataceae bacterium]|nr:YkgJ family cysteine cluster protein [Treponemataceae bacterium]